MKNTAQMVGVAFLLSLSFCDFHCHTLPALVLFIFVHFILSICFSLTLPFSLLLYLLHKWLSPNSWSLGNASRSTFALRLA